MGLGGTNFDFWAGANYDSEKNEYKPVTTTYDYDAPLNEMGWVTPKFYAIRDLIQKYTGNKVDFIGIQIPNATVPAFQTQIAGSIFDNLPPPVSNSKPLTFEALNQKFGIVLYVSVIPKSALKSGTNSLLISELHDYANVYIKGNYIQSIFRGASPNATITFQSDATEDISIEILVEAMGRISMGHQMSYDFKGITNFV